MGPTGKWLPMWIIAIAVLNAPWAAAQTETEKKPPSLHETTTRAAVEAHEMAKSRFDRFNEKAERLFKIIPVPLFYYSSQTGSVFGLAKYNLFKLSPEDEVSPPSKIAAVASFTTGGEFFVGGALTLYMGEDSYIYRIEGEFKEFPEYIFGIGNSVSVADREDITSKHWGARNCLLRRIGKTVFLGAVVDYQDYFEIIKEDGSFLDEEEVVGRDGGVSVGLGAMLIHDSRDNRHNPLTGSYAALSATYYSSTFYSDFSYHDYRLDLRKYFNVWHDHVLAAQVYTSTKVGEVPFYSLAKLGGPDRMRGYYQGALRDKTILDAQVEYRMPVWKIFGVAAFFGAGRVAESYSDMSSEDIRLSYGAGLRIMIDSENRANLRIDFGFGPDYGPEKTSVRSIDLRFTEAF